jgi:hypothetical protein
MSVFSTERTDCPWRRFWRRSPFSLPPRRRLTAKSLKSLMAEVGGSAEVEGLSH